MDRGVKIVLSSVVLIVGLLAALAFRPDPATLQQKKNQSDASAQIVLKVQEAPKSVPVPQRSSHTSFRPTRMTPSTQSADQYRTHWVEKTRLTARPTLATTVPPPELQRQFPAPATPDRNLLASRSASCETYGYLLPLPKRTRPATWLHKVVDGDTLETLAARYLGDSKFARTIYEANRNKLASPEGLPIGVELRIPSKPTKPVSATPRPLESIEEPKSQKQSVVGPLVPIAS